MNTFEFMRCSQDDVRVLSMFDKMMFDPPLIYLYVLNGVFQSDVSFKLLKSMTFVKMDSFSLKTQQFESFAIFVCCENFLIPFCIF